MTPRFKVCCIADTEEAELAVRYGASALGLVSEMPSGPGVIPEDQITRIAKTVPPGVASFLLTSKTRGKDIIAQQKRTGTNTIQLCDHLPFKEFKTLRLEMPGISLVQVIHVKGEESIKEAREIAKYADALLLDSGDKSLPVKQLGGTGRTHDWTVSKKIRESVSIPVFLAGGLTPENVAQAVKTVGPFGVDVCSGLRTDGRLDEEKLSRFVQALGY